MFNESLFGQIPDLITFSCSSFDDWESDSEMISGMGTKLERSFNLLPPSPNSKSFSVHCMDEVDYFQSKELNISFQITGLDKHRTSVKDRTSEKHNIDFIRKTIQMHEDTFKQQVRELHRLYNVQKMLMDELNKEIKRNKKNWSPITSSSKQHNPPTQTTYHYSFNFQDSRPREGSGSCPGEATRWITNGFDLERPAAEEAIDDPWATAGTSSFIPLKENHKMSMDGSDQEIEVELTLSIGGSCTSSKKMIMSTNQERGLSEQMQKGIKEIGSPASIKSQRGESCSDPTTPMSSSSATYDQERKQPHWLFQGLSINRTT